MVMKVMRASTKPILWIVVAAFVGTIIFAWGMDFTSRPAARGIVGEVNGTELRLDDYSFLYQNAITQRQNQVGEVSDEEARQLRDQVFEQMVQNLVLTEAIDRFGLTITNAELAEHLRRFPPQEVQQAEIFMTNGQFDYNKYMEAYNAADPQLWIQIESLVRPRILQQKLFEYVTATTLVDDPEVEQLYSAAREKVRVAHIFASSTSFYDSLPQVDSTQIAAYYEDHKDAYRHEERAKLIVANFEKRPSTEDTAYVLGDAEEIVNRARRGEDFAALAQTFSEDPGTPDGSLGWFGKGRMVKVFEDAAFALDTGEVSDPVLSNFGYHIIKVHGRRGVGDSVEVNASHILLKLDVSPGTLSDLRLRAEEFAERATAATFDSLAQAMAASVARTGFFERGGTRSPFASDPNVSEFAFNSEPGTISPAIETAKGFAVSLIDAREPAGFPPFAEVKGRITAEIRAELAKDIAYNSLLPVASAIASGTPMTEAAKSVGLTVDTTRAFGRYDNLPAFGNDPVLRGVAFSLTPEKPISEVVKLDRGAAILSYVEHTRPDPQEWVEKRDSVMVAALDGKRQLMFNSWFTQLRAAADVKDFRYELSGAF